MELNDRKRECRCISKSHSTATATATIAAAAATASKDSSSKTRLSTFLAASLFSLLFIYILPSSSTSSNPAHTGPDPYLFPSRRHTFTQIPSSDPAPPSIAYLISGSKGDLSRILRLLHAAYHPKNLYLLHLDLSAPQIERDELAITVQSVPIFKAAQNVNVIGKADFAYQKGSSSISATLHGASILLKLSSSWDWFVNLNAGDYPLVTQDDLLHILSYLPRNFNFMNHSNYIGWRESKKLKPIIVDPGLFLLEKTEMFYATQKRVLPNSFKLFTETTRVMRLKVLAGSSFSILSRSFIEHCILGTDNLPRLLLMYFANTPSSLANYFPTALCNSQQHRRTVINHNLQYAGFEKPSKPYWLNSSEFNTMIQSGAAFASQFLFKEPVLDRIDQEILGRKHGEVVPGGWCLGGEVGNITCSVWGDADVLRPGPGAERLEKLLVKLLSNGEFRAHQCIEE